MVLGRVLPQYLLAAGSTERCNYAGGPTLRLPATGQSASVLVVIIPPTGQFSGSTTHSTFGDKSPPVLLAPVLLRDLLTAGSTNCGKYARGHNLLLSPAGQSVTLLTPVLPRYRVAPGSTHYGNYAVGHSRSQPPTGQSAKVLDPVLTQYLLTAGNYPGFRSTIHPLHVFFHIFPFHIHMHVRSHCWPVILITTRNHVIALFKFNSMQCNFFQFFSTYLRWGGQWIGVNRLVVQF